MIVPKLIECRGCGAVYGAGYKLTDGRCKICGFKIILEVAHT